MGEPKDVTAAMLAATIAELPAARPRYLMGVGHPADLRRYARLGVDLFDCVLPTRLGRNGAVWTDLEGTRLHLDRKALLAETGPIMADCDCVTCVEWPLGALAAMHQSRDPLAYRLASVHNVALLERVVRDLRHTVLYTAGQAAMARSSPPT